VRHAIRDLLNVVNLEAGRVGNNNVVSRRHSALPHVLADEEEILPNKHNRFANQLTICVGIFDVLLRSTLVIPSTRRITLGDRAFSVTAAQAWNALLSSVRSAPSLLQFRRDIKTALFQSSYSSP